MNFVGQASPDRSDETNFVTLHPFNAKDASDAKVAIASFAPLALKINLPYRAIPCPAGA